MAKAAIEEGEKEGFVLILVVVEYALCGVKDYGIYNGFDTMS